MERLASKKAERANKIRRLESQFGAVYFPPQSLSLNFYTYEIQTYFRDNPGKDHIFEGSLEDVFETPKGVFAEFLISRPDLLDNGPSHLLILKVPITQIEKILKVEPPKFPSRLLSRYAPKHLVIGRISSVRTRTWVSKVRSGDENEVSIGPTHRNQLVFEGELYLFPDQQKPKTN